MSQVSTTSSVNATPGMVGDAMQLCHASVEESFSTCTRCHKYIQHRLTFSASPSLSAVVVNKV